MSDTLPLEKLEQNVDNLYEAIVIIARRARQINELQKRMIEKDGNFSSDLDDYEEEETIDRDVVESQYLKLPKPTTIALQEMLEGKLSYEYINGDD